MFFYFLSLKCLIFSHQLMADRIWRFTRGWFSFEMQLSASSINYRRVICSSWIPTSAPYPKTKECSAIYSTCRSRREDDWGFSRGSKPSFCSRSWREIEAIFSEDNPNEIREDKEQEELLPGQKGYIGRARVPKPSTRDYVVRPRSKVEGEFKVTHFGFIIFLLILVFLGSTEVSWCFQTIIF